ncbi:MAG: 4Fe-4S binding protein [Gammaproteobacteria bacterium]|nr:4Fe-4S binding protein [Gammaproteobacteria bacterium]
MIIKAFKVTLNYFFRKKVTITYPEQKTPRSERFRGMPCFVEENGKKKCIRCGQCVKICPAHAIDLKKYQIKSQRCIACGLCEEVCPVAAIKLTNKLAPPTTRKEK